MLVWRHQSTPAFPGWDNALETVPTMACCRFAVADNLLGKGQGDDGDEHGQCAAPEELVQPTSVERLVEVPLTTVSGEYPPENHNGQQCERRAGVVA